MFRKVLIAAAIVSVLLVGLGVAFAASPPGPGQPGQSCGSTTASSSPGNTTSASSPGSPFSTNGGVSAGVYANGPGTTPNHKITNPTAVSQYDVACFQVSQTHP